MNRTRNVALLVMALLLGLVAATAAAAEEPAPAAPITPNSPETEPNDDFDSATYIEHGSQRHGKIDPVGDVDHYWFYSGIGNAYALDFYKPATSPLVARIEVYYRDGTLLTEAVCVDNAPCLQFVANDWQDLIIKVTAQDGGGAAYEYRLTLTYLGNQDPNEPNDFASEAKPIAYDEWRYGDLEPCGDMDYFKFEGQAGQELDIDSDWWYVTRLLDQNQNLVAESNYDEYNLRVTLPSTGTYYVELHTDWYCDWGYGFYIAHLRQPIYMSFNKAGTVQGMSFTSGDVLRYWTDTGEFEMYLDMSDLGLKGNLTALGYGVDDYCWWNCDYFFTLGFAAKYTLPYVGTVQPQDLVAFMPESTGWYTSGWTDFLFDGSDVGLTTLGERIDAVGIPQWFYFDLILSTTGQAKVPYGLGWLTVPDEDLVHFVSDYSFGTNTAGRWWPYFDGSAYNLGAIDVIGADFDEYDALQGRTTWLVFNTAKTLNGISFASGDIVECFDTWYDDDEVCDSFTKFFDASDAGIAGVKIDAFEVGRKE